MCIRDRDSVERSIRSNPNNSYAYRNAGLIWQAKDNKAKACDAFEKALSLGFTTEYGPEVADLRKNYCK